MVKLLLCGQVDAQWPLVWERARKLHASAPYDALLCIGRVFPFPADFIAGAKQVPLPTYVLPAAEQLEQFQADDAQAPLVQKLRDADEKNETLVELLPNCFYLGRQGVAQVAGLQIAFVAGLDTPEHEAKQQIETLCTALKEDSGDLDFLLTADYAAHFGHLVPDAQLPEPLQKIQTSAPLASLLKQYAPRYHITSAARVSDGGVFYQRLPYVTESTTGGRKQLTRLIGLCGVNTAKDKTKKYLHALQVVPCAQQPDVPVDIPAGTTQNPYVQFDLQHRSAYEPAAKRQRTAAGAAGGGLNAEQIAALTAKTNSGSQFFYDQKIAARGQHAGALRPRDDHQRSRAPPVPERSECWFCLATPSVERHLIVSIGQEAYLAMPKGAINEDHALIVPIVHEASTSKLSTATLAEIDRFKHALREYFRAQDKEMIVFDRNILTIGATHCHMQIVGVPREKAAIALQAFLQEGEKYNVKFQELKPGDDVKTLTKDKPYFYAEVPDGQGGTVRLLNLVEAKQYMQFGRHACACVLGVPRRANWKFCVVPKSDEEALTTQFKSQWKPFDFTLALDEE